MAGQSHENDVATMVIVCKPSVSKAMGALHPAGALYARPVNMTSALQAHERFVALLRARGVVVRDVSEMLADRVDQYVGDRVALERLAATRLTYEVGRGGGKGGGGGGDGGGGGGGEGSGGSADGLGPVDARWVGDSYKKTVLEAMTAQQLVDTLFTNPTVTLAPTAGDTGLRASYRFEPLSNMIFARDQQITTRAGIVMARLRSAQRQHEVDIMEFCFRKAGLAVVGRVPPPGFLEGGDFFPMGPGLALVGVGPRSNWDAVAYLLAEDLFATERVAVVRDDLDRSQDRMHLDTVFNVIGDACCVMLRDMMGEHSPTRRAVDVYVRDPQGDHPPPPGFANGSDRLRVGKYRLDRSNVELSAFVRGEGFTIIEVSSEEQLNYGCNVLNLGGGHIVSTEKNSARRIATSPDFGGTVEYLDFEGVSCMYGSVHCACQVVMRGSRE